MLRQPRGWVRIPATAAGTGTAPHGIGRDMSHRVAIALLALSAALAGCSAPTGGQAPTGGTGGGANGANTSAVDGVWQSQGYGWIIAIKSGRQQWYANT